MTLAQGTKNNNVRWIKSSYSGGSGSDCVEVAISHQRTSVRDSKATQQGTLIIPSDVFAAFIDTLRGGEHSRSFMKGSLRS
nr:DUF397 domain-containing protein [Streptomyces tailanensis]